MSDFILGIDTSNYTTSAALYSADGSTVLQKKLTLPVKSGERGLRQSDAVFHHTQQLHTVIKELLEELPELPNITAVGVSDKPVRHHRGSYMPCFTVGSGAADILGSVLGVPVYKYSHQEGHIAAAVYSCGHEELYEKEFVAFHVSGGTTEAVLAKADDCGFSAKVVGRSLDLHAGQAIDRVGVRLGCTFPCGAQMEELALAYNGGEIKVKPCIKGCDCCLSGVENKCEELIQGGADKSLVAAYCIKYVSASVEGMCRAVLEKYGGRDALGKRPVLFAGGVMSDSIIKDDLSRKFECMFAKPEYSCDNAVGVAALAARRFSGD